MLMLDEFLIPTTILLALLGVLMSLPVLLPPIRKLSRGNVRARLAEIFVFGLLSFACGSVLLTWLNSAFVYGIGATMLSWTPEDFKQASPGAGVVIRCHILARTNTYYLSKQEVSNRTVLSYLFY